MLNRIVFNKKTYKLVNSFGQSINTLRSSNQINYWTPTAVTTSSKYFSSFNNSNKSFLINKFNCYEISKTQEPQIILPNLITHRIYCSSKKSNVNPTTNSSLENKKLQDESVNTKDIIEAEIPREMSIFAKFKIMYKKYWYVLLPVHVVTSVGWFFGFYFISQSGFDIPTYLEHLNISETMIDKVRNSNMGHYAIAYFCYKLVTPLRYAVTLGGTTVLIRYLVRLGYIKPMPTKQQVMDKFNKAKDDFNKAKDDLKQRRDDMVKKATGRTKTN